MNPTCQTYTAPLAPPSQRNQCLDNEKSERQVRHWQEEPTRRRLDQPGYLLSFKDHARRDRNALCILDDLLAFAYRVLLGAIVSGIYYCYFLQ